MYKTIFNSHVKTLKPFLSRQFCKSNLQQGNEHYSSAIPYLSVRDLKCERRLFDSILDVRTPAEFEEDRVPGALSIPVLSDEQRHVIGMQYSRSKFEARKQGAALISQNISQHLRHYFADKSSSYKPLIYCWRGGQRSKSLAIILQEIGFKPTLLLGGYKEYRRLVRARLFDTSSTSLVRPLRFVRISGATGSGKSLVLEVLRARGEQVLHLEELARHKGSVLGLYPGEKQPSQKMFESLLHQQLEAEFTPDKVVWVENESSKIGSNIIPLGVWRHMAASPRIQINLSLEDRVRYILSDYDYMCSAENKVFLTNIISSLERYTGKKRCNRWQDLIKNDKYEELVEELIVDYYDLNYKKPNNESTLNFVVPNGLMLNRDALEDSNLISDLIQFGLSLIGNVKIDERMENSIENH